MAVQPANRCGYGGARPIVNFRIRQTLDFVPQTFASVPQTFASVPQAFDFVPQTYGFRLPNLWF
jgi:hypothetical protein